jgi:hypothetical protein
MIGWGSPLGWEPKSLTFPSVLASEAKQSPACIAVPSRTRVLRSTRDDSLPAGPKPKIGTVGDTLPVTDGILHRIQAVEPRAGYRLCVTWSTGEQSDIDFSYDVQRGGVWTELRAAVLFDRARIAYDGTVLEWPEPLRANGEPKIDIDADGLWAMAEEQSETAQLLMQSAQK